MKKLCLILVAGLFFFSADAQVKKQDTTKSKSKAITGQDSISRHKAEQEKARREKDVPNKKREHKKHIDR